MCKRCRKVEPIEGSWYCAPCKKAADAQVARMSKLDAIEQQYRPAKGRPRKGYKWWSMRCRCRPESCDGSRRATKAQMLGRVHILAAD